MEKVQYIEKLNSVLRKHWQEYNYKQPTPIQAATLSLILEGKDMIAHSPTGTGKTLAYLLPILNRIDEEQKSTQVIILAPSRELVMQIYQEVQNWTRATNIQAVSLVGGANIKRQIDKLKLRPQIVVGSPGRILELIQLKKLKMHEVKTIVLDEGDQLLVQEHVDTVRTIIKSALNDRQLLVFSATKLKEPEQIKAILGRNPEIVTISEDELEHKGKVDHYYLLCDKRERAKLLKKIAAIKDVKALIFVRDVGNMQVLLQKLQYEKVSVEGLHSDLKKSDREKALTAFRKGRIKLLLATDVAARGLDIKGITHVIHYDLPRDKEQYIHRSGRTGRMGADGTVVSIVTPREERDIQKLANKLQVTIQKSRLFKGQFVKIK